MPGATGSSLDLVLLQFAIVFLINQLEHLPTKPDSPLGWHRKAHLRRARRCRLRERSHRQKLGVRRGIFLPQSWVLTCREEKCGSCSSWPYECTVWSFTPPSATPHPVSFCVLHYDTHGRSLAPGAQVRTFRRASKLEGQHCFASEGSATPRLRSAGAEKAHGCLVRFPQRDGEARHPSARLAARRWLKLSCGTVHPRFSRGVARSM